MRCSAQSTIPWTSYDLDAYLGISASPNNPIGAYLPSTIAVDPGATSFLCIKSASQMLRYRTLPIRISCRLTSQEPDWIATANSGAIFEDGTTPRGNAGTVPEPSSLILFGSAALGVAFFLRRKARARA
jgi:hypothetical protein